MYIPIYNRKEKEHFPNWNTKRNKGQEQVTSRMTTKPRSHGQIQAEFQNKICQIHPTNSYTRRVGPVPYDPWHQRRITLQIEQNFTKKKQQFIPF